MNFKELFKASVYFITDARCASSSMLQHEFGIDYFRASALMDELECTGFIGPVEGTHPRKILSENVAKAEQRLAAIEKAGAEIIDHNTYVLKVSRFNSVGQNMGRAMLLELNRIFEVDFKLGEFESFRLICDFPDNEDIEVKTGSYEQLEPMKDYLCKRNYTSRIWLQKKYYN